MFTESDRTEPKTRWSRCGRTVIPGARPRAAGHHVIQDGRVQGLADCLTHSGDGWLPTEEGKLYCLFVLETRKLATPRLMKLIWHWGNADGWFPLHRCCAKVLWKFNMLWLQSCRQDRHPGERQEWELNTNTRTHTHTQTRTHRREHERAHA